MKTHWQTKKLGEVLSVQNGHAFDSKGFSIEEGVPLIRIRDLKNGTTTETKYKGNYDDRYEVKAGDFLIGMDGEFGCYEWCGEKALLNQRVCRLQDFKGLEPRFLFYGINKYLKDIEANTGFTTVKHISSRQIENIIFTYPKSLSEQIRIVKKLDDIFEKVTTAKENAEKNLQNSKEFFESYLQSVFANPGKDWETKRLNEISENLDSKRVPITKHVRSSGKYPYYGASGIVDYVGEYIFDGDLLLVSEDGANLLARTYPIVFSINGKSWVNNHAHVLKFEKIESQKFIEYYLNSIKLDPYVSGMAQPKLNQKMLNSIPVPYPSFSEQKSIIGKLYALSVETKKLEKIYEQKVADLEELKKSVLKKAFSGEL